MLRSVSMYLFAAVFLLCEAARAEALSPYHVKAACLYNFLKFVEWPAPTLPKDAPYVVGVLGKDPFGAILDTTMTGKTVNGRRIIVMRVTEQNMRQAHLLYISPSERKRYGSILEMLKGTPVLTVGETAEFAETGGNIEFFLEKNKVRFQINPDAAKHADLRIDSTLLNLARIVRSE